MNKEQVKFVNLKILMSELFTGRIFRLVHIKISHTTVCRHTRVYVFAPLQHFSSPKWPGGVLNLTHLLTYIVDFKHGGHMYCSLADRMSMSPHE